MIYYKIFCNIEPSSLHAPPSQQHALYAGDSYGSAASSAASSANSSTKLSQSSSLGGLGLGSRTTNSSFSAELSSPLGGPMTSPSVGYGSSAPRPNVGGPEQPSPPSTQLGLGLAGSSALGLGQAVDAHSLNAHNNRLYNGNPNVNPNALIFEDDLQRLFAHSDATASRLASGLNSNGQSASGVSPTTHSTATSA